MTTDTTKSPGSRILELESIVLTAFAELRALVETAEREKRAAAREREELLPDYTEREAAALLNISAHKLGEERALFRFPHVTHGTAIRYTRENITQIRRMRTQNARTSFAK